jgi:hypothetical protein
MPTSFSGAYYYHLNCAPVICRGSIPPTRRVCQEFSREAAISPCFLQLLAISPVFSGHVLRYPVFQLAFRYDKSARFAACLYADSEWQDALLNTVCQRLVSDTHPRDTQSVTCLG